MSLLQTPYNGHGSQVKHKHAGLFAVIEDVFYKSKQGTGNHELKKLCPLKDSDKIRKESSYIYSTPETVSKSSTPEYQTIPEYSKITDARLVIDENIDPKVSRQDGQNSQVSVASSLGTVKGPEYPHRQNLAPATLQPAVQRNPQPRKLDENSEINTRRNDFNYKIRTSLKNIKNPTSKPYFKSHNKQYDPFAFQATQRSTTKEQSLTEKRIFSNRLDSRFSIQVMSLNIKMHRIEILILYQESNYISSKTQNNKYKNPVIISYREAVKLRKKPEDTRFSIKVNRLNNELSNCKIYLISGVKLCQL